MLVRLVTTRVVVVAAIVVTAKVVPTKALLQMAMRLLLVRVVLIVVAIVLVVKLLSPLPGLVLRLLAIDVVGALCLGQAVDFTASEAGEELFGEAVGYCFSCWRISHAQAARDSGMMAHTFLPLLVFEHLHGHEGSASGE